tara:strand:- start:113738 stop:113848 length:111 start_codon:yes stop_codon:yes gene_type:complete
MHEVYLILITLKRTIKKVATKKAETNASAFPMRKYA